MIGLAFYPPAPLENLTAIIDWQFGVCFRALS